MAELVDTEEGVMKNVRTFAGYEIAQVDRKRKMKNVMHFVGCKNNGRYSFAPSEFVGLKNNNRVENGLLQNEKDRRYAALTNLLGEPYKMGVPGYPEIYAAYEAYCISHGTIPNAQQNTRVFWLIDSDAPRSQHPANNARHATGNADTLPLDLENVNSDKTIDETTRQTLIDARIGQGNFRKNVMMRWEGACAFSGCTTQEALRASHIRPWRDCNNKERLDPDNGLMLTANLDALFDRYLISFDDNGKILISSRLSEDEKKILGVRDGSLRIKPNEEQRSYLTHHGKIFDQKNSSVSR